MSKGFKGKDWFLYYNTNSDFQTVLTSYDTPTWSPVPDCQDISVRLPREQLEKLRRGAKVKEYELGFGEFSLEFNIDYIRDSSFLTQLRAHIDAQDESFLHLMVLDGTNATGSKGYEMPAIFPSNDMEAPILGKTNVPLVAVPAYKYIASAYREWKAITIA